MGDSMAIQAPEAAPQTSNRVVSGTLSMVGNTIVSPETTTLRCNEKDLAPNTATMMSTAQNNGGFSTANITPESTIEIPGIGRTSVKVAERLGYIERTGDGLYKETFQADFDVAPGDIQKDPPKDTFAPRTEAAYNEMISSIPQGTYDSLLGSAAALIGNTEGTDMDTALMGLAPRLASSMGIEPARAEAMIRAGSDAWQGQADRKVASLGADPDAFYEWAKANRKNELQQAVVQQLYARNTRGYEALVKDFKHNTMPSAKELEGYTTKVQNGETLIEFNEGNWMSLKTARKMGLI